MIQQDMTNFGPLLMAYEPFDEFFRRDRRDLALDAVDWEEEDPWIRASQYIEAKKDIRNRRRLGELPAPEPVQRKTQEEEEVMEVSFENCRFEVRCLLAMERHDCLRWTFGVRLTLVLRVLFVVMTTEKQPDCQDARN